MSVTLRLFLKDLVIEYRRGELISLALMGIVGMSLLLSYGVSLAGLTETQRLDLAPSLSLSVLLISALSLIGKFSEYDSESKALEGLLVAKVSSEALYLSRVCSLFVITLATACIAALVLPTLLGLSSAVLYKSFAGIIAFSGVSFGLASCGALFAPMTARLRVGAIFLLTLMLPLMIPLFLAACEVLSGVESTKEFWWTVIASLDAIYLTAGLWLHPYVVR